LFLRQLSFDNVQIRTAHAAGFHAQEHMPRPHARIGNIDDLQGALGDRLGSGENSGFHSVGL
jgi:hypothetical protein